jgi:hypothetical protein
MKATSLLTGQHRTLAGLLDKLALEEMDHSVDVQRLANCLRAHAILEREAFYPAIAEIDPDIVHESHEEHALAEGALQLLVATDAHDPAFYARLMALKEAIACHMEEEEQDVFPMIEQAWEEHDLRKLGAAMSGRFEEIHKGVVSLAVEAGSDDAKAGDAIAPAFRRNFHWRAGAEHLALRPSR